ncbi:MAG: hypothetical protein IJ809_03905 [Clostridia bacterium]|nr:hypothetical protein [Clostridia bacterium]
MGILKKVFKKEKTNNPSSKNIKEEKTLNEVVNGSNSEKAPKLEKEEEKAKEEITEKELMQICSVEARKFGQDVYLPQNYDSSLSNTTYPNYKRVYKYEKKASICEFVVLNAEHDFNFIFSYIKKLDTDSFIRFFVVTQNGIRISNLFSLEDEDVKNDIIKFLGRNEEGKKNVVKIEDIFKEIMLDSFALDDYSTEYIYKVENISLTFYGFYSVILENMTEKFVKNLDGIISKYETSFYTLSDDVVDIAALGFRNIYLL